MPRSLAAFLTALATALPLVALAQGTAADQEKRDAAKAKYESMTPEQQAAAKEKARANWNAKTPEEQAAAKEKAKANWNAKTPEEKEEAKKRFQERRRGGAAGATPAPAAASAAK